VNGARRRPVRAAARGGLAVILVALATSPTGMARVFLTQKEALVRVFSPDLPVDRRTVFLTEDQAARVRSVSGGDLDSLVVTFYVGNRREGGTAIAYFDSHRVRTLPETLMVVVDPEGRVMRIEVLSFLEPPDYLPRPRWYEQFEGRKLEDSLSLKRSIHGITGATLSARVVTRAVRRVLAIDTILREDGRISQRGVGGGLE
jgi:hypothetical protein